MLAHLHDKITSGSDYDYITSLLSDDNLITVLNDVILGHDNLYYISRISFLISFGCVRIRLQLPTRCCILYTAILTAN